MSNRFAGGRQEKVADRSLNKIEVSIYIINRRAVEHDGEQRNNSNEN